MSLKDMGNKKKARLDYRCSECKKRFSIANLLEEGYAEKINGLLSVECPNCGNKEFIKK